MSLAFGGEFRSEDTDLAAEAFWWYIKPWDGMNFPGDDCRQRKDGEPHLTLELKFKN